MLVLCHRGYHANVPHNTMEAFEQAVGMGADGIETDVRLTADGIAVLFHDRCVGPNLQRVADMTHVELEKVVGYSVPTLAAALAEWTDVFWNLEIKAASAVKATSDLVRQHRSKTKLIITSFLHPIVYELVSYLPVEGGLLFAHSPMHAKSHLIASKMNPKITTLVWDYECCDQHLIRISAELGFNNFVYGAIAHSEHEELASWDIQGAITDYPQFLLKSGGFLLKSGGANHRARCWRTEV
jgi:glycerophosphoryl diester phosphodiesterase